MKRSDCMLALQDFPLTQSVTASSLPMILTVAAKVTRSPHA